EVIPREQVNEKKYISVKTPVAEIGTDPDMAWYAEYHTAKTLILKGSKEGIIFGPAFGAETSAIKIPVNGVVGIVLKDPVTALEAGLIAEEDNRKQLHASVSDELSIRDYAKQHLRDREVIAADNAPNAVTESKNSDSKNLQGLVYKARPLNGIWATAPYLHNGSVPNLWELLQRPEK